MSERVEGLPQRESEDLSDLGFLISQVGDHSQRLFSKLIQPLGLRPSHVGVLRAVAAAKGPTQRDLGERLGIFASNLVKLIDELEEMALIERVQREGDRRSYRILLTREGERAIQNILTKVREHQSAMCSALLPAEQSQLHHLLQKIAGMQGLRPGVHPEFFGGRRRGAKTKKAAAAKSSAPE